MDSEEAEEDALLEAEVAVLQVRANYFDFRTVYRGGGGSDGGGVQTTARQYLLERTASGGRSWTDSSTTGEGGWSMVSRKALYKEVKAALHYGPGSVVIIPAVSGCNCEHRCVALDESRTTVKCVCSHGWNLAQDGTTCVCTYT